MSIFNERSAVFAPFAGISVRYTVDIQMLRLMDMAADDTIAVSIKRVSNNLFSKARYVSTK